MITLLKKYGAILLVAIIGMFAYFKMKKNSPTDVNKEALAVLESEHIQQDMAVFYKNIALSLAHNLGTAYAKYDPRNWTENDKKVFDIMKNLDREDFKIVSKLYNQVYAKGFDLSTDLRKLLDAKLYEQLEVK